MEREVMAVFRAITSNPDYRTTEKLEANIGGWGSFNIGVWAATNVLVKEAVGKEMILKTVNTLETDVDDVARKVARKLVQCGADPANAALVTAILLYWTGVNVTCGIPCPNRKLGAIARMAAGAPPGRVSDLPSEKTNNKISAWPAVSAIYEALQRERIAPYDANLLPVGLAGSPFLGHTSLGEDHLFPTLADRLTRIGAQAMMRAFESVGIKPNRWESAIFAAAAALEIIHPDTYVGEEFGPYLKVRSTDICGRAAVDELKMPEVVHIRGTGEELETAKLVGDIGLILKDVGTPTVVGMTMFNEVCSIIQEGPMFGVGRSGGPIMLPLHHWVTAAPLVVHYLAKGMSEDECITALRAYTDGYFQAEDAALAINLLAHRAQYAERGPVTDIIIRATEPVLTNYVTKHAKYAYEQLKGGKTLEELVEDVEGKHTRITEEGTARVMSKILNKKIEYIRFTNIHPGSGRHKARLAQRYFAFDPELDVEVKVDDKVYKFENFLREWVPKIIMEPDMENLEGMKAVCLGVTDLINSGACNVDMLVCACMATALGMDCKEAAAKTIDASRYRIAIPTDSVDLAAKMTADIMKGLDF